MSEDGRIYLDHAATTPPDPAVVEAMLPYLTERWHNPSSIYIEAQTARRALDESRASVATLIGASADEIVFTSGGTESNNLALRGVLAATERRGRHLVTTGAEHHAILDPAEQMERNGTEVTVVDVEADGHVEPSAVAEAVRDGHRARLGDAREQRGRIDQ